MLTSLKRYVRPLGLLLGIVTTVAFVWYAARALQAEDLSHFTSPRGIAAVLVAALCYATIIPSSAFAWQMLLRELGESRNLRSLTEILAVSQFAKYIPGNIGVHLGRAGMALGRGMHARAVVASLLAEGLLAVAAALIVGALGLIASSGGSEALAHSSLRSGVAMAAWVLAAVAAIGFVVRFFAPRVLRERLAAHRAWPSAGAMLRASTVYVANYGVIALGMWALTALLFPGRTHDIGLLAAAFSLAWAAGFFAPGAPAGLGIREALMVVLLRAAYSPADALVIVVGMRLATILADLVIFIAGNAALLQARRVAPPDSSPPEARLPRGGTDRRTDGRE